MHTPNRTLYRRDRRQTLETLSQRADAKSVELAGRSREDLALVLRAKVAGLQYGSAVRIQLLDIIAIGLVALERHDELQNERIAITLGDRHLVDVPPLTRAP